MSNIPKPTRCNVIPCMRYRDAPAAIDWLCNTFGFEATLVVPNDDGRVAHAQLDFGNSVIMLSSIFDTEFGRLMKQPAEVAQFNTQSSYLVVNDADLVYARARAAGAEIALELKDEEYGGRGFTCRDPEGHLWSIGTYDPQAELRAAIKS